MKWFVSGLRISNSEFGVRRRGSRFRGSGFSFWMLGFRAEGADDYTSQGQMQRKLRDPLPDSPLSISKNKDDCTSQFPRQLFLHSNIEPFTTPLQEQQSSRAFLGFHVSVGESSSPSPSFQTPHACPKPSSKLTSGMPMPMCHGLGFRV